MRLLDSRRRYDTVRKYSLSCLSTYHSRVARPPDAMFRLLVDAEHDRTGC